MKHEFKRIVDFEILSQGVLALRFSCGEERTVNLTPIMKGPVFGELKQPEFFHKVTLDEEVGTICWPNGADFDPDTLFRWEQVVNRIASNLQSA